MKNRFLKTIRPLAAQIPLNWLIRLTGQRLFLPFYHTVSRESKLPHIHHLYPLRTLAEFEKEIDFILKHYRPISLQGLFDQLKSGKPLEQNTFFLSFDDGLREIADFISPLLLRKGVPATIFLNANFVDNKDLFFRYKASLIIDHFEKNKISDAQEKKIQKVLQHKNIRQGILEISYQNQKKLEQLATFIDLDFKLFLKQYQPYLNSDQIKSLSQKGFTFGSHSVDHPLYSEISTEEQIRQTKESQRFINKNFPQDIKAFAFPFTDHGVSKKYFDQIRKENIVDISFGTAGLKNDSATFHLQRFPAEAFSFPLHQLIPAEYFYFMGKSLLGKNEIKRH